MHESREHGRGGGFLVGGFALAYGVIIAGNRLYLKSGLELAEETLVGYRSFPQYGLPFPQFYRWGHRLCITLPLLPSLSTKYGYGCGKLFRPV